MPRLRTCTAPRSGRAGGWRGLKPVMHPESAENEKGNYADTHREMWVFTGASRCGLGARAAARFHRCESKAIEEKEKDVRLGLHRLPFNFPS